MVIDTKEPLTITPSTNRCFQWLTTAGAALVGYIQGHLAHAGYDPQPNHGSPVTQVCFVEPVEIVLDARQLLDPITNLAWPSELLLRFQNRGPGPIPRTDSLSGIQRLMGSLYEIAFIAYFEAIRDLIESRYGHKVAGWREPLNFGRVVRNAFAHGGTIEIRDATSAAWRGVSYSGSDNGRQVMYNDLSAGDITLLMLDMDQLL